MNMRFVLLMLLVGAVVSVPSPVWAAGEQESNNQSASGARLEEVVVTARRHEEDIQTTPIAVSVLTETQLKAQYADTIIDIATQLPNLQMFRQAGVGDVATTYLRGFGIASADPSVDPPVAMYVDGIYIPQVNGTMVDMFDVAKIEIARGPQGTLLGKNATVGAIMITTKGPTGELGANIQLDYGAYDRYGIRGRVDVPLIQDVLAMNISILHDKGGDYTYNEFTRKHDMSGVDKRVVRVGLEWTPSERFNWLVKASGAFNRDPQNADRDGSENISYPPIADYIPSSCSLYGHCTPIPFWHTAAQQGVKNHSDTYFVSSSMSYEFDPVTVTLYNGYMNFATTRNNDIDGQPEIIIEQNGSDTVWWEATEELRIASNTGGGWDLDGKLDWQLGAYFFNETYRTDGSLLVLDVFALGGIPVLNGQKGKTDSQAVYGHSIYYLTDVVNVFFGVRQTWDHKRHSFYLGAKGTPFIDDPSASWTNTSYEAGVQYQLRDDKMLYFRFAQGYRGGGFIGVPNPADLAGTFDPETNDTYEVGAKTEWWDGRVRINATLFRGEYSDLQKNVYIPNPNSPSNLISVTRNAASATVQGIEIEAWARPTPELNIGVNFGYLDPEYDNYVADLIGNGDLMDLTDSQEFGFSPHYTASVNASYFVDLGGAAGSLTLRGSYNYRSEQFLFDVTTDAAYQSGYGLANASLKWTSESEEYSLSVFGKNIFNKKYLADTAPISLMTVLVDGPRMTWGVSLSANL